MLGKEIEIGNLQSDLKSFSDTVTNIRLRSPGLFDEDWRPDPKTVCQCIKEVDSQLLQETQFARLKIGVAIALLLLVFVLEMWLH